MRHEHGILAALRPDRNAHGAGGICARNALAARSAFGGRRIALIAIAHTSSCPRLKQQRAHAKKKASMHAMAGHCTCKGCKAQRDLCTIVGPMHLLTSLVYVRLNMTPNIFLRVRIPLALPGPIAEHASRVLPGPLGATVCTRP